MKTLYNLLILIYIILNFLYANDTIKVVSDSQYSLEQGGILKIEEELPLSQLGQFIGANENNELLPNKDKDITVNIVIPKGLSEEEEMTFENAIKSQIEKEYHGKIKYKIRKVKIDPEEVAEFGKEMFLNDNEDSQNNPLKAVHNQIVEKLRKWKENFRTWIKNLKGNTETKLMAMGSAIGVSKSIGGINYWMSSTGLNIFGVAQSLLSITLDQVFSTFIQKINSFKANHTLPFLKETKFVKFYNSNPVFKSFVINQLIGLSCSSAFRTLSYLNKPNEVKPPWSSEFLGTFAGLSLAGTVVGSMGDVAPNTLLKNNRIPPWMEWLIYQGYGSLFMINGLLFNSGNTDLLPLGILAEWAPKLALTATAKALPPKNDRIIVIHDGVKGTALKDIEYRLAISEKMGGTKQVLSKDEFFKTKDLFSPIDNRSFQTKVKEKIDAYSKKISQTIGSLCRKIFGAKKQ